jgi:hypothetical protein
MKTQSYPVRTLFIAAIILFLLASSSTYAATVKIFKNTFVPQSDFRWVEKIPAEDMEWMPPKPPPPPPPRPPPSHPTAWSPLGVQFRPSGNWGFPKIGDTLCRLYDNFFQQIWWSSSFHKASTEVWVQLNGCDRRCGNAEIYVDDNLTCTVDTDSRQVGNAVLIAITNLPLAKHKVEIRTTTNPDPLRGDVSIDYVAWPRTRHGWDCQEHFQNRTGRTVYDLTKVLLGNWIVTDAIRNAPFTYWVSFPFGGITIIHWWGGSVPPNGWAAACFNTLDYQAPPARAAFWTDQCGRFIGLAGATFRLNLQIKRNVVLGEGDNLELSVEHTWRDWTAGPNDVSYFPTDTVGLGAPPHSTIDVNNIQYAIVDEPFDLNQMDVNFVDDHPEVNWIPVRTYPVSLAVDENDPCAAMAFFDLGLFENFDANKVMIVRGESDVYITYPSPGGTELVRSREMIQVPLNEIERMPRELQADFTQDAKVDFHDFDVFADQWLNCNDLFDPNCTGYFGP